MICDRWYKYYVYILWLFNSGILWNIYNVIVYQWVVCWFGENGDKVCFGIYFVDCYGGIVGIYQIVDDDKVFVIVFCMFQYFQFVLVIMVVVGDVYGINMMNVQFMCQ